MSVTNNTNSWGTWANDQTQGDNFIKNVTQQTSSIQTQLNTLIQQYQNGQINYETFETESAPLISQMNAYISGLSSQYGSLSQRNNGNNPLMTAVNNLNTAWQTTLQTFANMDVVVPNPNYPNNSNQPTIQLQSDGNGMSQVSFTSPYNHYNGEGVYLNGVQNLPWLPGSDSLVSDNLDPNGDQFYNFLLEADQNQHQTLTCVYNGEAVSVVANGDGTMTVTIMGPTSVFGGSTPSTPSTSSLSSFLNSI